MENLLALENMPLFLLLLFFPFLLQASPTGFLDLSTFPFQERSFESLDGSWRFAPGLVEPYQTVPDSLTMDVPGYWDASLNLVAGTYQLQIDLPENYNEPLALYVPEQSSAYRLWVGDSLVAAKGIVNTDLQKMQPAAGDTLVLMPSGKHWVITLQVASPDPSRAGISSSILIGKISVLLLRHNLSIALDALVVGALLMMALYQIILFVHRRFWSYLTLALVCLFWGISFASYGQGGRLLLMLFPSLSYDFLATAEMIPVIIIPAFMYHFLSENFPRIMPRWVHWGILGCCTLGVLLVLILPLKIWSRLVTVYQVFDLLCFVPVFLLLGISMRRHLKNSVILFLGVLLFLFAGVNDVLYDLRVLNTGYFTQYGLLIFVVAFGFVLSRNYVRFQATLVKQTEYLRRAHLMRHHLEQILNTIKDPLFAVREDGEIVYANVACLALLGYSVREGQVYSLNDWVAPDSISKKVLSEMIQSDEAIVHQQIENLVLVDAGQKKHQTRAMVSSIPIDDMMLSICVIDPSAPQSAEAVIQAANDQQTRAEEWATLQQAYALQETQKNPKLSKILKSMDASLTEVKALLRNTPSEEQQKRVVLAVELLNTALRLWVGQNPSKSKADLARESGLWTVYMNLDGWERTQTLDRYLAVETFPVKAHWERILKTIQFVLASPGITDAESRKQLERQLEVLQNRL